eukprot:TRINITY_DN12193_c0_g1_i2.p1 TRINITY_DN12193_c0_g1~~TRINITY_DN12193_c0_g1_i2.p1  ORF type:complete len:348 (+),score=132.44 TRINITY_DN12193_c0_g1_i2:132-1175(+)
MHRHHTGTALRVVRRRATLQARKGASESGAVLPASGGSSSGAAQKATAAAAQACEASSSAPMPSRQQLRTLFMHSAVPMVGFGLMDQLVMISCGDLIDNTFGVRFGLATLTAAACGQVVSDLTGVCFGGVVGGFAAKLGLPAPDLTSAQRNLKRVRRVATAGAACGVVCGCLTGMSLLLLLDTTAKEREKKQREMETIFRTIMDHSHDLMGADMCSLFIVDEAKNELWSKVATDSDGTVSSAKPKLITVPLSKPSIAGEVVRTGRLINVADCYKDPRFYQGVDDKFQQRTRNLLAVPVLAPDGRVIAVIEMMNKRSGAFGPGDEKLCTMLAHHVAVFFRQLQGDSNE